MWNLGVRVHREKPSDRSELGGDRLTGVVDARVSCISWVHVGSGSVEPVDVPRVSREKLRALSMDDMMRAWGGAAAKEAAAFVKYSGEPVIPGSSLKGVVRSRLELLITSSNGESYSCFRLSTRPPREPRVGSHGWRHVRVWSPSPSEDRRGCPGGDVCPVCNLFGAPGLASRVFFGNFSLEEGGLEVLELDHGEVVEAARPGSVFSGRVSFMGLEPWELGLLLVGMGAREDGGFVDILLGKSKYRVRVRREGGEVEMGRVRFGVKGLYTTRGPGAEGPGLKDYLSRLVSEAASRVRGLRVGFSEADVARRLG